MAERYLTVYGKKKGGKRFLPMNTRAGALVHNRIHMTIFQLDKREELEKFVARINKSTPEYVFEIREQVAKAN